jgi:transcriptional regulator
VLRGEDAYVTPAWYPSYRAGTQTVPTWNYEVVQATGRLVTHTDPAWIESQVRALAAQHEASYDLDGVDPDALAGMLRALVGIEILVTSVEGKSKLSQNRSTTDIDGVAEGLEGIGRDVLADRIRNVSTPYAAVREGAVESARLHRRD